MRFLNFQLMTWYILLFTCSCVTSQPSQNLSSAASSNSTGGVKDDSKNQNDSSQIDTAGSSVIVKPYKDAIEFIEEDCRGNYEVLSEKPQSSEVGISVPVGEDSSRGAHWFVRYRCKGGMH